MAHTKTKDEGRFRELDVLRGFAAVWVLLFHYLTRYDELFPPRGDVPFHFPDGTYGVQLFFIISGFVIFMTLKRCKTGADFVVSRFSRLYPAYWAACLLTFAVGLAWPLPGEVHSFGDLAVNLTMLQNFFGVPSVDGVYWSLAVELCFYTVMLALFLAGYLSGTVRLAAIWLAAALISHLLPRLGAEVPWKIQGLFVLNFAELFVAGIVFYEIHTRGVARARLAILAACLAVHLAGYGLASAARVLFMFVLMGVALSGRARFVCVRPLLWLGAISYTLYLTHQMIGYTILAGLGARGIGSIYAVPLTAAVMIGVASLLTLAVERPAMRAIRQAYKRRHAKAAVNLPDVQGA